MGSLAWTVARLSPPREETAGVLGFAVWTQVVAGNGVLPLLVEPVAVAAVRAEVMTVAAVVLFPVVLAY